MNLYNELEPFAAEWLENLSDAGHIAAGTVDQRSIADLQPDDVRDATQFHAFAGIGGWSLALRLAGWPDDVGVWTGSCPCQPFSSAGRRRGTADERHLWPEWFRLIRECRPPILFGEQVANGAGAAWLEAVSADLEGVGYAIAAADLCAASVGAPHIRQRLWFMAYAYGERHHIAAALKRHASSWYDTRGRSEASSVVIPGSRRRVGQDDEVRAGRDVAISASGMGDADVCRRGRRASIASACEREDAQRDASRAGARMEHWSNAHWIVCADGKARPTQPGIEPLAHGIPGRVGRLRAYGNAIVPQVAAQFIRASVQAIGDVTCTRW